MHINTGPDRAGGGGLGGLSSVVAASISVHASKTAQPVLIFKAVCNDL